MELSKTFRLDSIACQEHFLHDLLKQDHKCTGKNANADGKLRIIVHICLFPNILSCSNNAFFWNLSFFNLHIITANS